MMNEFIEAFTLPLTGYNGMKYISGVDEKMQLFTNYMIYQTCCVIETEDEKLGMTVERMYDTQSYLKRSDISYVDFGYSDRKDTYQTTLFMNSGLEFTIVYPDKEYGIPINAKIISWWLND